jgi:hypothetical protein
MKVPNSQKTGLLKLHRFFDQAHEMVPVQNNDGFLAGGPDVLVMLHVLHTQARKSIVGMGVLSSLCCHAMSIPEYHAHADMNVARPAIGEHLLWGQVLGSRGTTEWVGFSLLIELF